MKSTIVPVLALALALAPALAAAHIETFTQTKAVVIGPYSGVVRPQPDVIFANSTILVKAIFTDTANGTLATPSATLELVGPSGEAKDAQMKPDGTGYVAASVAVLEPGNYTARIVLEDDQGEYANETTFPVYPDLPIRFRADPAQSDPFVGQSYPIVIETIDKTTLAPKDAFTDLTLLLERWTDDHVEMLGVDTVSLHHDGTGKWKADHVFPVKGMYHLRFSSVSGGFKPDDVPILHVYALDPPPGSNKMPLPQAGLFVALALAALALGRRQRRGP